MDRSQWEDQSLVVVIFLALLLMMLFDAVSFVVVSIMLALTVVVYNYVANHVIVRQNSWFRAAKWDEVAKLTLLIVVGFLMGVDALLLSTQEILGPPSASLAALGLGISVVLQLTLALGICVLILLMTLSTLAEEYIFRGDLKVVHQFSQVSLMTGAMSMVVYSLVVYALGWSTIFSLMALLFAAICIFATVFDEVGKQELRDARGIVVVFLLFLGGQLIAAPLSLVTEPSFSILIKSVGSLSVIFFLLISFVAYFTSRQSATNGR